MCREVRKLAEESGGAAGEIGKLIDGLQNQTKASVEVTEEAGELMKKTVAQANEARKGLGETLKQIEVVNDSMQSIAATSQEQAASANEMANAVDQASRSTVEMAQKVGAIRDAAEETSQAAETVAKEAENVSNLSRSIEEKLSSFVIRKRNSDIATR